MRGAAAAMALPWPMGLGGHSGWPARVGPSGSARSSRIDFSSFFDFILMRKQFQKTSRNFLKARKILQKSQKFQKNS
jgi:hypothetical protein